MTSAEAAVLPSSHHHSHSSQDNQMVANIYSPSATGTPPESPSQGRRHSSFAFMTGSVKVSSSSPAKKSPKNNTRRASYATAEQSPSRLTMGDSSAQNSPVPLGSRPQPSSAAAPVVGHHQKNNSLVGFDPLLNDAILAKTPPRNALDNNKKVAQPEPTTPKMPKEPAIPASYSNLTVSPPSPPIIAKDIGAEMTTELRKIAKELAADSPQRASASASSKVAKPKFGGRATSLTPKFNLTPPFRGSMSTRNLDTGVKEPQSTPHRKLPWQRHRRSRSLETPDTIIQQTSSLENDATKANHNNMNFVPASPMMQDLFDVVKEQESTVSCLALPNLAKPAATSFLTGTEIVRSSEQDPSPFQMEIPSLDQTLVAARLVQFVEHYRKEDMNLDLSMSFVGLNRPTMRSFVESNDNSAAPPNLTQAHKPVVESLLEAADDVSVAGFFSSENAGSADARREAVILERQMQFVVVFRGTTQEQGGKTGFFKKNHAKPKHQVPLEPLVNDGTESKVFAPIKQAYMELERAVFDRLDNLLDSNPFCDVVFTGSSMGGSMAMLGAYRYAYNRPMVRVTCQSFGAPKAGNKVFRSQVNSLPNLKVMRVEYANDAKCLAPPQDNGNGAHAGHSIALSKGSENNSLSAVACKFENGKHHSAKQAASTLFKNAFKKERDISSYVSHLEQLQQSKVSKWMKDFAGEDGTGVRGNDNEQRQMV